MAKRFLLLLALLFSFAGLHSDEDHYNLASYKRSGNTWVRYCIEYLFKCPTIGPGGGSYNGALPYKNREALYKLIDGPFNAPIDNYLPIGVDYSNPVFIKIHHLKDITNLSGPLVLILRNYKECIASDLARESPSLVFMKMEKRIKLTENVYFTNLEVFDQYQGKKLLLYYEDLMERPKETLAKLCKFVNRPCNLSEFIAHLPEHKEKLLDYYMRLGSSQSFTKGEDQKFFSSKFTSKQKTSLDDIVKKKYPELTKKYLKRYLEN